MGRAAGAPFCGRASGCEPRGHRLRRRRQVQRTALAAKLAEVRGMVGIAADARDSAFRVLDHDAAADAAIRARRARLSTSVERHVDDAALDFTGKRRAHPTSGATARRSQARSTSCAAGRRRDRRRRCPATAVRPCADSGRARRTRDRRRCERRRRCRRDGRALDHARAEHWDVGERDAADRLRRHGRSSLPSGWRFRFTATLELPQVDARLASSRATGRARRRA